ncbi:hypothetical protein EMIHUDRAFT_250694 [Emiliania huxleyi CCMP1516]|uniref:General transcription factor 3C polypeptide 3 n=2 Tax=Emiliania huxleyi TaxID=2903 RepID=A0A0D3HYQ7_EMIH1|nr:hypothetical protein EMIHUDRAFT_250694 [Emiliania huxleyi CCMP1516]EOD04142.1 hypothetical protein EMIHUDRAFT_250694 [Emiliania huxleyi CCMP1516]|eukprot:XP_005756571.1 hypothetical protein EMIHUDRAFT_250694 [Emiliania huxleyi CCMP1516]
MSVTVPPEVQRQLGEATMLYAYRDFQKAMAMLLEVVRLCPRLPHPYETLGLIYEEEGHKKKALQLYLMAANLSRRDAAQWRRLAVLATEVGEAEQALFCLGKTLALTPDDVDSLWEQARLHTQLGQHRKAAAGLASLLQHRPHDAHVVRQLAISYTELGAADRAIELLSHALIERGAYSDGIARVQALRQSEALGLGGKELPLDLRVREGVCCAYTGDSWRTEATAAEAVYLTVGRPLVALELYDRLLASERHVALPSCLTAASAYSSALAVDACSQEALVAACCLSLRRRKPREARCALSDLGEHGAAAALLQPLHDTCFEQLVPTGSKRGKGKRAVAGAQAASRAEEEEEGGRSSAPKRPRLAVSPPAASPPRCGQDEAAAPTAAPPAASVFRQGAEVLPAATAPGRETAGVAGSA